MFKQNITNKVDKKKLNLKKTNPKIKPEKIRPPKIENPKVTKIKNNIKLGFSVFFIIFTTLSIFTHDYSDISLNRISSEDVKNILGIPGSYYSDIIFQAFGLISYLIPAFFAIYFIKKSLVKKDIFVSFLIQSGLISIVSALMMGIVYNFDSYYCGLTGSVLSPFIVSLVGATYSYFAISVILTVLFIFLFNIPVFSLTAMLFINLKTKIVNYFAQLKQAKLEAKELKEEESINEQIKEVYSEREFTFKSYEDENYDNWFEQKETELSNDDIELSQCENENLFVDCDKVFVDCDDKNIHEINKSFISTEEDNLIDEVFNQTTVFKKPKETFVENENFIEQKILMLDYKRDDITLVYIKDELKRIEEKQLILFADNVIYDELRNNNYENRAEFFQIDDSHLIEPSTIEAETSTMSISSLEESLQTTETVVQNDELPIINENNISVSNSNEIITMGFNPLNETTEVTNENEPSTMNISSLEDVTPTNETVVQNDKVASILTNIDKLFQEYDSLPKQTKSETEIISKTDIESEEELKIDLKSKFRNAFEMIEDDEIEETEEITENFDEIELINEEIIDKNKEFEEVCLTETTTNKPEEIKNIIEIKSCKRKQLNFATQTTRIIDENSGKYELPSVEFLDYKLPSNNEIDETMLIENANKIVECLEDFKIKGTLVKEIFQGPTITTYELEIKRGTKITDVTKYSEEIASFLKVGNIRMVPVTQKGVIAIEVPNKSRETVWLKEIIGSQHYQNSIRKSKLVFALGKGINGEPIIANLAKMPHLLIAGTTGSGKSVFTNVIITSIIFNATPDEVKFILIDPKMLEFSIYNDIPNLLFPVITDAKKASYALQWAVDEMERRYQLIADFGEKDIESYNKKVKYAMDDKTNIEIKKQIEEYEFIKKELLEDEIITEAERKSEYDELNEKIFELNNKLNYEVLPYIVIVLDEYADLMMVAAKDVEMSIARIAQKARAAGIHLVIATQRPDREIVTGIIKANLPVRVALSVKGATNSRIILDDNGAEKLLGQGDMLYMGPGTSELVRIQSPWVSTDEQKKVLDFLRKQGSPTYDLSVLNQYDDSDEAVMVSEDDKDDKYIEAIKIASENNTISASYLQRRLKLGYNRAARIVEIMEKEGIVGPANGSKPRKVIQIPEEYLS